MKRLVAAFSLVALVSCRSAWLGTYYTPAQGQTVDTLVAERGQPEGGITRAVIGETEAEAWNYSYGPYGFLVVYVQPDERGVPVVVGWTADAREAH